jgi:hypothetical protein
MPSVFFSVVDNAAQENKDETGHVNPRIPASSYKIPEFLDQYGSYLQAMYSQ